MTGACRHFTYRWGSRFLITLATFGFTTFRFFYMQDRMSLDADNAVAAVSTGVPVHTVVPLVVSPIAGWLSDRLGRRKVFPQTLAPALGGVLLAINRVNNRDYDLLWVAGIAGVGALVILPIKTVR